ncbi:MAG: ABC transporter ATP-binding protein [Mycobacteriales bacterium]
MSVHTDARAQPQPDGSPVLAIEGLGVRAGAVDLLIDVSLTVGAGERVGIIGESGSGKSLTALSALGLLPDGLRSSGSVRLAGVGHDLIDARERDLARIRGSQVAMVFQEPMTALNPTMRVGEQISEAMLLHATRPERGAARRAAVDLLAQVMLPDPARAARAYPHQLSGGQRQRVVLAIALANDPSLLICDEPTTALDVTVQAQILDLVVRGVRARDAALLFITHDLAVVATVCQRVVVMYGGRVVEAGPVRDVFRRPRHRYTEGLLASSDLEAVPPAERLPTIPGTVPSAGRFPAGCVFRNRCGYTDQACEQLPTWSGGGPSAGYGCWHPAPVPA